MTHKRWLVGVTLVAISAIAYIDRANLSVAEPVLIKDFHTNDAVMGLVLSSYLWTYAALQIPVGAVIDRISARVLYTITLAVWSVASFATALVGSVGALFGVRLVLGVGEAPFVPLGVRVLSEWIPQRERGLGGSFVVVGVAAGTAVSAPSLGFLVSDYGWQSAFIASGALSGLIAIGWAIWYRSVAKARKLSAAERQLITSGQEPHRKEGIAPWSALIRHRNIWALATGYFFLLYILYTFISWLPGYLVQARHFDVLKSGLYTAVPWICAFFAGLLGGYISDRAHRRGASPLRSRKITLVIGMIAALAVIPSAFVPSAGAAVALLSVSASGIIFANGAVWAATQDVVRSLQLEGSASGFINFCGNLGGILGPIVTGFLATATGSFIAPLVVAGGCALGAALVWGIGVRSQAAPDAAVPTATGARTAR